jgi:predicted nucleic acid-binding protein
MILLKRKLLFDTHAFLALFNREDGSETIKKMMEEIQTDSTEGFAATITLTELAYIYSRNDKAAAGRLRVTQILHSKIRIIPLSPEIAVIAGTLKQPGISIADAIIAASARAAGALVVTNDSHFSAMGVDVTRYP